MKGSAIILLVLVLVVVYYFYTGSPAPASAAAAAATTTSAAPVTNPFAGNALTKTLDTNINLSAIILPGSTISQAPSSAAVINTIPSTFSTKPIIKTASFNSSALAAAVSNSSAAAAASASPPASFYVKPVNGAKQPALSDWLTGMQTKQSFLTFLTNMRPYNNNELFNPAPPPPAFGHWYIIDSTHWIKVAFDDDGWPQQFMLVSKSYPFFPSFQASPTAVTPDPTLWWAGYEGPNNQGPTTVYGTPLFT